MYWVILKLLWSLKKNHIYFPFFKNAPAFFFFDKPHLSGKISNLRKANLTQNDLVLIVQCCLDFARMQGFVLHFSVPAVFWFKNHKHSIFFFLHWLCEDISKFQINSTATFQRNSEKQTEFQMELSSWTLKWHFNKHRRNEVRKLTNYQLCSTASVEKPELKVNIYSYVW